MLYSVHLFFSWQIMNTFILFTNLNELSAARIDRSGLEETVWARTSLSWMTLLTRWPRLAGMACCLKWSMTLIWLVFYLKRNMFPFDFGQLLLDKEKNLNYCSKLCQWIWQDSFFGTFLLLDSCMDAHTSNTAAPTNAALMPRTSHGSPYFCQTYHSKVLILSYNYAVAINACNFY